MVNYKKGAFLNVCKGNPALWEEDFRRIEALPLRQHIEIWLEHMPTTKERRILKDMLSQTEVIVHSPFVHLSLVSHLDALGDVSLTRCREAIDLANFLEAKLVTIHAGTYPVFDTQEIAFERLVRRFSTLASLKAPIVSIENMPVRDGTTRECLGRLDDLRHLRVIMPEVRFTLDIGHSLQNGDDFESFLREERANIENIHLHDGKSGERSHLKIGAGILDLKRLLLVLKEIGFNKYVSLETISVDDTKESWQTWLDAEQSVNT